MKTLLAVFLLAALFQSNAFAQNPRVLINHLGYEADGPKRAVIQGRGSDDVTAFKVLTYPGNNVVLSGSVSQAGPVQKWKDWHFWTLEFGSATNEGAHVLECATSKGPIRSFPFLIQSNILERHTLSPVVFYFKGQRASGLLDQADRRLKLEDGTVDARGGWYDASGDYGKHLSHLSFSTYFNPQQTPIVVWSLFKTHDELARRNDPNFRQFKRRLLDEAMHGADFLVRMKAPGGSFYRSVGAPGYEKAPQDRRLGKEGTGFAIKTLETKKRGFMGETNETMGRIPYQVGHRAGAGVSIASLALASTFTNTGEFSRADYLKAAEDAFAFLEEHNESFANDGRENIVDDYCALLAATELFKATHAARYKTAADRRAAKLMDRLIASGKHTNYFRANDADRPFFHAADAGMPVVSLLGYHDVADDSARRRVLDTVRKALEFELQITSEVNNPFGYARQLVQSTNGFRRTAFFFPHDTETAPWWQGENARLGSIAAAARMAAKHFKTDAAFHRRLQAHASDQLNWILGLNPYDACMLHGIGRNNIEYMFFTAYEYCNAPGGICNGISGGYSDPDDIDFDLGFMKTGKDDDWRWGEQWLPHGAWYLFAISME